MCSPLCLQWDEGHLTSKHMFSIILPVNMMNMNNMNNMNNTNNTNTNNTNNFIDLNDNDQI